MLHRKKQISSRIAGLTFWCFTIANGLAVIWGKLPVFSSEFGEYTSLRLSGKEHGDIVIFICSLGIFVSALVLRVVGRMATWDTLHSLISDLRIIMVDPEDEQPVSTKATIYKATKVCHLDPWYKWIFCRVGTSPRWLLPVVRSNHLDQKTKTCFAIGDSPESCIGVTGQAWAQERILFVTLPDVTGENPYPKVVAAYSARGYVSKDWIKLHKPSCRTVLAIPLVVAGDHWGVLVFHSRTANRVEFSDIEPIATVVQKHVVQLLSKHL